MTLRVLLADDHEVYRRELRQRLDREPGLEVVGEAADAETALRLARELGPDLVIMDVVMPRVGGIEATRRIAASCPGVRVIALSMHADEGFVRAMTEAGARGYFLKDGDFRELVQGALEAAGGEGSLPSRDLPTPSQDS